MVKFGTLEFAPYPRAEIRKLLISTGGVPPQYLDEVTDIAVHAAESGRRSMLEVLDRASDGRVSLTAIGLAASLLRADLELLEKGLKHSAEQAGLTTYEGPLRMKPDA